MNAKGNPFYSIYGVELENFKAKPGDAYYVGLRLETVDRTELAAHPERFVEAIGSGYKFSDPVPDHPDKAFAYRKGGERPAYASLDEATRAYLWEVQRRLNVLANSKDPKERELAKRVLAGDPEAFATLMTMSHEGNAGGAAFGKYNPLSTYKADLLMKHQEVKKRWDAK